MPHGLVRYQCCIHAILCSLRSLFLEIRVPPHWLITGLPIVEAIACLPPKAGLATYNTASVPVSLLAANMCLLIQTLSVTLGAAVQITQAGQGKGRARAGRNEVPSLLYMGRHTPHTHTSVFVSHSLSHPHPQVDWGCEARGCHGATRQQGFAARLSNLESTALAR